MNTRHLIFTVAFGASMLGPAPARAESAPTTASVSAKPYSSRADHRSALDPRLVAKRDSERMPADDEQQLVRRGELVEALLQWTERLVTRLDPFDVLETPFQPVPSVDRVGTPGPIAERWKPIPRLRPVVLPGGYGLVARITF